MMFVTISIRIIQALEQKFHHIECQFDNLQRVQFDSLQRLQWSNGGLCDDTMFVCLNILSGVSM